MKTKEDVVNALVSILGTKEDPDGSNHNFITEWYADISGQAWARSGNPWCAMTVSWVLHKAGFDWFTYAYCPYIERDARAGVNGMSFGTTPQVGSPVLYDLEGSHMATHVGTVVVVNADGTFVTIEGNWRNAVVRLVRDMKYVRGFVYLPYQAGNEGEFVMDQEARDALAEIQHEAQTAREQAAGANMNAKVANDKSTHVEAMLGSLITALKKKGVIDND